MAEWLNAVVLKTTEPVRVPGVRIPLDPLRSVAQFGSALALGARGRQFKSGHSDLHFGPVV